ncbi:hypothetical protein ACFPOD_15575 [Nitratireductor kimnyeongensis]|uniref:Superfamily III holin-X n=1 Tax=Nitratireductor kimnyeongensis TaxID=430679 RepID=A0ABW0TB62_9HYPH|nr:hypothetical protein [Nitratireductor kimnyeongensis]QZZ36813.1 hypothetical protein KW403_06715 [Nitratireductor kimnyeongensis]
MPDDIPPIDPDLKAGNEERHARHEEVEFELLKTEAALRILSKREIGQRYIIKWVAVGAGVLVIFGMALALWHMMHNIFWGPFVFVTPALSVAMIVAPVISITTITVALFVGAFRKFDDKDLDTVGSGVNGVTSTMRGIY